MGTPVRPAGQAGRRDARRLRKLWTGEVVEHHGEFFDFDPLEMLPAPTEPIPICVGGVSDIALRRAARNDGWISDLHTIEELAEIRSRSTGTARSTAGTTCRSRCTGPHATPGTWTATAASTTPVSRT